MFGLGVNRLGRLNSSTQAFTPASLFKNGEAGVWYDPSAASGSLDWRRNLFEYTESFDNSYWDKATSDSTAVPVVTANQAIAPDGTQTADLVNLTAPADNQWALVRKTSLATVNRAPKIQQSVWLKAYDSAQVGKKLNAYIYDTTANAYKTVGVIALTTEWQRIEVLHSFTSGAQNIEVSFGKARNTAGGITQAETATQFYIWGAQVEEASTASSYQPILSTFERAFKAAFPSHTLYQDYLGVTPVTAVGEPVGLMLDKSEGLAQGPELVTNGDFATDSDWAISAAAAASNISNNVAYIESGGSNASLTQQLTGLVAGKSYQISFNLISKVGYGLAYLRVAGLDVPNATSLLARLGEQSYIFIAGSGSQQLRFMTYAIAANSFTIDNVSVKEIQGSHATQPTSTKRPIYARHPEGGIRNLLNYTEQLDNSAWVKVQTTVTANATTAPDGTTTADKVIPNTVFNQHRVDQATTSTAGVQTLSAYVKNAGYGYVWMRIGGTGAVVSLADGSVSGIQTGVTAQSQDVGNGWIKFSISRAALANETARINVIPTASQSNFSGDGTSGVYMWGAQLEQATEASNYQKVVTDIDVTESGVGEVYYLKFDGTDDGMTINNLTSPSTPITALFGYSATNANAFNGKFLVDILTGRTVFGASTDAASQIGYFDGAWEDFSADSNAIKVLTYDLVENDAKVRVDGTQEYSDTTYDQKAIGGLIGLFERYDSSGNYLAGNMYQTILRAAESTDEEIAKAETYVANKTGLKAQVDGIATLDLNFGANTYTAKNSNGGVI